MTPEEVEKIVRRTLGRPETDPDDELRKLAAAYDGAIAAKDETIRLLRERIDLLTEALKRWETARAC